MFEAAEKESALIKTLFRLAASGARRESIKDISVDWIAVVPLAEKMRVSSLVACALLHSNELDCPEDLRQYFLNTMRLKSATNIVKRQRILNLIDEIQKMGYSLTVLKGYAISAYYAYPECRDSADADLLVEKKQETAIYQFLKEKGFEIIPRSYTSHQGVCRHSKYGIIEIHAYLYDEIVKNVWFRGMTERDIIIEEPVGLSIDGYTIRTLGYTDHLIFLALHLIKHFISSGISIQMILDLALFFEANSSRIDFERFWSIMDTMNYTVLVNSILWIAIQYGGFQKCSFPGIGAKNTETMDLLLDDLTLGGYVGNKFIQEFHDSSMEYSRRILLQRGTYVQYIRYMLGWKLRSALGHMFPGRSQLDEQYPILRKYPVIYPAMVIYQAFMYPVSKIRTGILARQIRSERTALSDNAKKRIKMFEELNMI